MTSKFGQILADKVAPPPVDAFTPLNYKPTPRQEAFHEASRSGINAILYGGAAGGGKSCAFLMDAIWFACNIPRIKIGCFRRSYPELEESFLRELTKRDYARALGARWHATKKTLTFPNGSTINFSYAENEVDASRILGGEYQVFYIDEAGLVPPAVLQQIEERLRSGDRTIPVIGIRFATNPGGASHKYLKDRFLGPTDRGRLPWAVERVEGTKKARKVAFIPAKVTDNPHVDEGYEAVLAGIADPQRRAAMRDGNWDAMVGQFFTQWSYERHVIPEHWELPKGWARYCGVDYGFVAPWAVCWAAQDQDGRVWVYRELYASGVQSNVQGKILLEAEQAGGDDEVIRVGDPSMWGQRGTPLTVADEYGIVGCGISPSNNDRINGWARVHSFLNEGPACEYHASKGWKTCPMVHVFGDSCPSFIEYIPSLPRSKTKPDDAETTNVEDHMPDAFRYLCMAVGTYARPIIYDDDPKPPTDQQAPTTPGAPTPPVQQPEPATGEPLTLYGGMFVARSSGESVFT